MVEHLIRAVASADGDARLFTGQCQIARRSCAAARRAALRLAQDLAQDCGELSVHALLTVNASPACEPRTVTGARVLPAGRLSEIVQRAPGSLSPIELRLVNDALGGLPGLS